jgi:hypothetical protein
MQLGQFSESLNKQCQNNYLNPSKYSQPCDIQSFGLLIQFLKAFSQSFRGHWKIAEPRFFRV